MTRTLFIGVDGATFTVLDRLTGWGSEGTAQMPFLRQLMEHGVRARLRSTPNPLTAPAWVSLMTGRTPGHHGVFDFLRAEERGSDVYFTLCDARDVRTEMIWSIASRGGRTVAALNFPITAPPRPVAGSIVPGFVPWKHLRRNVYPRELFDRLTVLDGFDPKGLAWDFELESRAMDVLSPGEVKRWVEYHIPREAQWFRIAERLLVEDAPDLMAVMFDGTDKIQHQAWPYLTSPESAADDEYAREMRALCVRYFTNLDTYIERLVTAAGPGAQVFIASDHGFTGSHRIVRINSFLEEKGYLAWRRGDGTAASERRQRSWFADLEWSRTVAYCRTPSSNGITIRVARNAGEQGIAPSEYETFRRRLVAELEELRDPTTGERVIAAIHPREQVFCGSAMADAPDLTLTLADHGFVSIANVHPVVEQRPTVVGTHHPEGVFIAAGAGVAAARSIEPRDIVDVCATLLYSLGLPVPADFDGAVPLAMFTEEHQERHPLRRGRPTANPDPAPAPAAMADDDRERIIRQMQLLGYME